MTIKKEHQINQNLMINRNIGFLIMLDQFKETVEYEADDIIDYYYPLSEEETEIIDNSYRFFYPEKSIITKKVYDDDGIVIADFLRLIARKLEQDYEITELEYVICKEIFKWQGIDYADLKTEKITMEF